MLLARRFIALTICTIGLVTGIGACGGGADPDTPQGRCEASCETIDGCRNTSDSDCEAQCTKLLRVATASRCQNDVYGQFDCVAGQQDACATAEVECGTELGFSCIDQYCEAHPDDADCK